VIRSAFSHYIKRNLSKCLDRVDVRRPPAAWTISAASATGCTAPVSLLASITDTSAGARFGAARAGGPDPTGRNRYPDRADRFGRKPPHLPAPRRARWPRPTTFRSEVRKSRRSPGVSASAFASVPPGRKDHVSRPGTHRAGDPCPCRLDQPTAWGLRHGPRTGAV